MKKKKNKRSTLVLKTLISLDHELRTLRNRAHFHLKFDQFTDQSDHRQKSLEIDSKIMNLTIGDSRDGKAVFEEDREDAKEKNEKSDLLDNVENTLNKKQKRKNKLLKKMSQSIIFLKNHTISFVFFSFFNYSEKKKSMVFRLLDAESISSRVERW